MSKSTIEVKIRCNVVVALVAPSVDRLKKKMENAAYHRDQVPSEETRTDEENNDKVSEQAISDRHAAFVALPLIHRLTTLAHHRHNQRLISRRMPVYCCLELAHFCRITSLSRPSSFGRKS